MNREKLHGMEDNLIAGALNIGGGCGAGCGCDIESAVLCQPDY